MVNSPGQRDSVIRVALAVLNRQGWSTEEGKNATGFVLTKNGERLLVVSHGRWDLNQEERDQLYGRLLRLYSRYPEASRGVLVLPDSATGYLDEVSREVRAALGIEVAVVDSAGETMDWVDGAPHPEPEPVELDDASAKPTDRRKSGVVARLRRVFT